MRTEKDGNFFLFLPDAGRKKGVKPGRKEVGRKKQSIEKQLGGAAVVGDFGTNERTNERGWRKSSRLLLLCSLSLFSSLARSLGLSQQSSGGSWGAKRRRRRRRLQGRPTVRRRKNEKRRLILRPGSRTVRRRTPPLLAATSPMGRPLCRRRRCCFPRIYEAEKIFSFSFSRGWDKKERKEVGRGE